MPLTIPPELKKITPYVRRAEELDRDTSNPESRLVSYYCRQWAVHTGIPLALSNEGKSCLGDLLGNLEGEKDAMSAFTREESNFLCTKFAEKIFDKADGEDRSGGANRNTARTFYAAASFLEILQQFYNDEDESEELSEHKKKSVYCKWKATEILKAIKEGRTPMPGGYGEQDVGNNNEGGNEDEKKEEEEQEQKTGPPGLSSSSTPPLVETITDDDDDDDQKEYPIPPKVSHDDDDDDDDGGEDEGTEVQLGPPPSYPLGIEPVVLPPPSVSEPLPPPLPQIPKPPMTFNPPPSPPPLPNIPPPPTAEPRALPTAESKSKNFLGGLLGGKGGKKKKVSKVEVADATELTRFALAALEKKNADLAADRLQQALQILRG